MERNVIKKEKFGNNIVDVMYDVVFDDEDKFNIKENRKRFYNEGKFVIDKLFSGKRKEISFVELKEIFRSNKYVMDLYRGIVRNNVGYFMSYDFVSYSDRFLSNVNGMIRSDINIEIIKKSNGRLFLSKEKVIFDNLKDLGLYEYRKMNGVWIYVSNDYKESKGWFDDDIEI